MDNEKLSQNFQINMNTTNVFAENIIPSYYFEFRNVNNEQEDKFKKIEINYNVPGTNGKYYLIFSTRNN